LYFEVKVDPEEYIALLKELISTPSFSREEDKTATIIDDFFKAKSIETHRIKNNVVAKNKYFDPDKSTILLNSHHDTVKPNSSWKKDPFTPTVISKKLYGLGSNDAGGALVGLIAAFVNFFDQDQLNYNLIIAATAEEEISGKAGVASVLDEYGFIDFGIVGEPTSGRMAVAEKGLMVLDCISKGTAGHAAREEGDNAIYKAMQNIEWFKSYCFDKQSESLGDIKMSVTMINSGTQHNVVPDRCNFVVDVRSTDAYSNHEILEIVQQNVSCEVVPRSTRLQPSGLPKNHALFKSAAKLNLQMYGSPTLSDQALMSFPSVKIGPGDSARSHAADEYIELQELKDGIEMYIEILNTLV